MLLMWLVARRAETGIVTTFKPLANLELVPYRSVISFLGAEWCRFAKHVPFRSYTMLPLDSKRRRMLKRQSQGSEAPPRSPLVPQIDVDILCNQKAYT